MKMPALAGLGALAAATLLAACLGSAQDAVAQAATVAPIREPASFSRAIAWILEQQRAFHAELTRGLRSLRAGGGMAAAIGLVLASFLYGVFHAAGPGHGKAVLTTYLLTHRQRAARGVLLAAAASFCQGATAVALVYGLVGVAGWLPRETSTAVAWSERLSYALVILVGALLAGRAVRDLALALGRPAQGCGCGDSHVPSVEQVERATDIGAALGLILSIGLRPCSGAILMLALAHAVGLDWAGILAVAAMSTGAALAVAGLAFLAVNARRWVVATAGKPRSWGGGVADLAALAGGAIVMILGVSLAAASFAPPHPLGLP